MYRVKFANREVGVEELPAREAVVGVRLEEVDREGPRALRRRHQQRPYGCVVRAALRSHRGDRLEPRRGRLGRQRDLRLAQPGHQRCDIRRERPLELLDAIAVDEELPALGQDLKSDAVAAQTIRERRGRWWRSWIFTR